MNIVIDTETTGLSPLIDELLQLSIIDTDKNVIYNDYFCPRYTKEWPAASKVNRIYYDHVKFKPYFSEVRGDIQQIFDNATSIIGYNTQFDLQFLRAAGIVLPSDCAYFDVMEMFAPLGGSFLSSGRPRWVKLVDCATFFGFDWSEAPAHDALGDCFATLYCFKALKKRVHP